MLILCLILWHVVICFCDKCIDNMLRIGVDMQDAVNVSVMYAFVNRLFCGLECEHMSILSCCCCCIAR